MSKTYPWEEYKEAIERVYITENNSLWELKEYLQTVDPTFKPCDRAIKMHLRDWGFTKNRRGPSCPSPPSPEPQLASFLPMPRSAISFSEERSTAPIVKEQTTTSNTAHLMQPSIIAHRDVGDIGNHQQYIKQAGAAILSTLGLGTVFLRNLKIPQEEMQNGLSVMEVGLAKLNREPQYQLSLLDRYHRTCEQFPPNASFWHSYLGSGNANDMKLYLDTMYSYAEQLEIPHAHLWHTATLNTIVGFLTPVHSFHQASSIVRILPIAMRSPRLLFPRKEEVCYQFLRKFLEFEGSPSVLPDGLLRGAEESSFAFRNYTPATLVHYLRLTLKLAMQKPVIERGHAKIFTATLCKMVGSLVKQLHDSEGGGGPELLADSHSNEAGAKELKLPTNNLTHNVQMTPIGLAFQLQFFAWVHQTVNWDYPNYNAEHLVVTMIEHLISIAIVIAKRNRSEKRTQTRDYLSIFALGMNTALPVILDPKHCCWLVPSHCGSSNLVNICRGRCGRYLEIFNHFERFCHDGIRNVDFSEREDIISKLSKDTADFRDWVTELSSNMRCPS